MPYRHAFADKKMGAGKAFTQRAMTIVSNCFYMGGQDVGTTVCIFSKASKTVTPS